jgi:diadenosine tetraphosphatase ApaH/serine/threonine PP2A family protein phosphatase
VKDARLDLGRYIQNPFNRRGEIAKRLDFDDLFSAKPETGDYPWNPSRFNERDLLKRSMTRKVTLNPDLNFVGNTPFFDDNDPNASYELFEGLGRFNRPEDYDFDEGRARTEQRPQQQPDFNPNWIEAYNLSPTLNPGKSAKNPMPRLRNPDPNGYLMAAAERRAENEFEDKPSIAQLLDRQGVIKAQEKKTEEREGEETVDAEGVETNVSPGKTQE